MQNKPENTPEKQRQPKPPEADLRPPRLYSDPLFFKLFEALQSDAEKVEYQRAIYDYAFFGKLPLLFSSSAVAGFFKVVRGLIDSDKLQYQWKILNNETKQQRPRRNPYNQHHLEIEKFIEAQRVSQDLARRQRDAKAEALLMKDSQQKHALDMLDIFRGQLQIDNDRLQIRELEAVEFVIKHGLDNESAQKPKDVCAWLWDYNASKAFEERKQQLKNADKIDFLEILKRATTAVENKIATAKNAGNDDLTQYLRATEPKVAKPRLAKKPPVDAEAKPPATKFTPTDPNNICDAKRFFNACAGAISKKPENLKLREPETIELIKQHGLELDPDKRRHVYTEVFEFAQSAYASRQAMNGKKIDVFRAVKKAIAKIEAVAVETKP